MLRVCALVKHLLNHNDRPDPDNNFPEPKQMFSGRFFCPKPKNSSLSVTNVKEKQQIISSFRSWNQQMFDIFAW